MYAVRQFVAGRRVGGRLNVRDVSSDYAQRRKRFAVARLDRFDENEGAWIEAVVQDHHTPPADQAAFRIDFPAWLATHTSRNRRIAEALAVGHTTNHVAHKFGISAGRVSQLRTNFRQSWDRFQGEQSKAGDAIPK
jgi:hypothetical protein